MVNNNTDDNDKTFEALFEPQNAEILANLEDGSKTPSELAETLGIKEEKLDEQITYLKEMKFVIKTDKDGSVYYSVDKNKLSEVLENDDNFKNIDDGLAKLDSFLN
ncbi:MAG: ArsR family transcriptional regulator [Nitrososphaerales archaeon]|jgi:DNA-binding transcriptional ArsR family regulator|nr:ArsR family transcriptional regulator [Nitrososphaerales archaeon]